MLLALALATVAVSAWGTSRPASGVDHSKGSPGFCPTATGVTVVVDFQQLGGDPIVRCFPSGSRGTGLDALKGSGFQIAGVQRWGESFICRIENRPSAVETLPIHGNPSYQERCVDTPPAGGYWSYWVAGNNCSWQYSQWGAKNRDFVPGGFEGWSFSLNATAAANPKPRVAAVRPGTDGGPCTTANEPPAPSDDPDQRLTTTTSSPTVAPPPTLAPGRGTGAGGGGQPSDAPVGGAPDRGSSGGGPELAPGASGSPGGPTTTASAIPSATAAPLADEGEVEAAGGDAPGPTIDRGDSEADDPDANVAFTGGELAADVHDVLREQSGANPAAPWLAGVVVAGLIVGAVVVGRTRRAARDA